MPRQPNDLETAQDEVLRNMIGDGKEDADENEEAPLGNEPGDDEEIVEEDNDENDDFEAEDDADETATEPVVDQRQQQQRQQPQQPDPNDRFQFKQDREGNLVDKDGKVVFKKGKPREIFTRLKKAYLTEQDRVTQVSQQFTQTVAAAKQLLSRYNDLKAQKNVAEKLGLTPAEAQEAAEMRALMKLDPKQAIRTILTKAHLSGTDLKDIGVTGPLDAKTVAAHMLELQKAQQPPAPTEEDEAKKEAEAFLKRHPTARQYTTPIAQAKMRYPHMTLDEIWFQLLDFAKRQNGKTATGPVAGGKKPNRPIPHNASRPRQMNGKISLKAVDPSQSFRDIGKQLLADIQAAERE